MLAVAGEPMTLVWQNAVGGLTGRVDGQSPRFVKWNPFGSGESLRAEAGRLRWLEGRHPAPVVLEYRADEQAEILVTRALPGISGVDPRWRGRADEAIRAMAVGLRRLHDLPTSGCPFVWDVATRSLEAPETLSDELLTPPEIDRLVICHGDACAPNTLLDDLGFTGNVDFGRLGLADRWADLAVATMSLAWNYDNFNEDVFWEAYGVEPDPVRVDYYRRLWNAT
jgi:kanamycin kinase